MLCLAATAAAPETRAGGSDVSAAISEGDVSALRAQFAAGAALGEARGRGGKTALMVAARAGDALLVEGLIAGGADVRATSENGGTALMFAAYAGSPQVVSLLLEAGADVHAVGGFHWSALSLAAVKGRRDVARILLEAGADANHPDVYAWTPLMRAIDNGHRGFAVAFAGDARVRVDAVDELGWTALHHAARRGAAEVAETLLERGVDVGVLNVDQRTAADLAELAGHAALAERLR